MSALILYFSIALLIFLGLFFSGILIFSKKIEGKESTARHITEDDLQCVFTASSIIAVGWIILLPIIGFIFLLYWALRRLGIEIV